MAEQTVNNTTPFTAIYDRFLNKITDDMYVELTQADTIKDLQALLIDAIPHFEFPRFSLYDYVISTETKNREDVDDKDFIIGVIWHSLDDMVANGMEEEDEGIIVPDYGNPED